MFLYFLFIRIAAFFGHRKARKLVQGQKEAFRFEPSAVKGCIWIHAASVGEFEQARPIIEKLRSHQPSAISKKPLKIIVTFFSPSGYEARKNYELADGVYYLPFATRRNAKKFIEALQPKMAVFVKYEFWPAYIRELKKRNIPTYSICAYFRPKQYFFRWWGKGQLKTLRAFTHIFVQDEASKELLAKHQVTNVTVAGDTRFDRMNELTKQSAISSQYSDRLTPIAQFVEGCSRVIIAGSTWQEDEILLQQYMSTDRFTDGTQITDQVTKLILVPHELNEEHLHFIFNLFQGRYVTYSSVNTDRFTDRTQNTDLPESRQNILRRADVLVVDTMGLLSSIYRFGQVAYIGGGFGEGIHNTIEAASYGMPVVFGTNYHAFREAHDLIRIGAAQSIQNYSELESALESALAQHETLGQKATEYIQSELGATAKICDRIFAK